MLITKNSEFSRYWFPLCFVDDVADRPVGRRILDTPVVAWLSADGPQAAVDSCPHRNAKLSLGRRVDDELVCPYHGWRFGGDGTCTSIPQQGNNVHITPRAKLWKLPTRVALGILWTSLAADPVGQVPTVPELDSPEWRSFREDDATWNCEAPLIVDHDVDCGHYFAVHSETFSKVNDTVVPLERPERTDFGIVAKGPSFVTGHLRSPGGDDSWFCQETQVWAPFTTVTRFTYPDGFCQITIRAVAPATEGVSRVMQICLRNDPEGSCGENEIRQFDRVLAAEDRVILETIETQFSLDLDQNAHAQFDAGSIAFREMLADLLHGSWCPGPDAPSAGPDSRSAVLSESSRV